jgi:hypothetical protein
MDPAQDETKADEEPVVRFHKPGEPLSPAAQEALNRRSMDEHRAAIEQALRRG